MGHKIKRLKDRERPIIFVVESGGLCGGVRIILEYLNRLHERGWHVEVYSLDQNKPTWFPLHTGIPWWKFANYGHLVRHLAERDAFKVATWWKTAYAVAEASKAGEGFYLIQDIEMSYYTAPKQQEEVSDSYNLGLAHFTTSKWVKNRLPGTYYVGIGLDLDLYRPLAARRQINAILSLSRPQRLKGWSLHCEVYRKLHHTKKFALRTFGVMGVHPPFSTPLPRGISDEELVQWYNRTGIFLSTSQHEGFSLTLLEAMACGAVVVCTDADGNMQFCRDKENSLVVPFGDADALVSACEYLLDSPDTLIKLQEGGFETAQQWPWEPVIDRLEALFCD